MNRPIYDPGSTRDCRACGHAMAHDIPEDDFPGPCHGDNGRGYCWCDETSRYALDMEAYATWLEQERDRKRQKVIDLKMLLLLRKVEVVRAEDEIEELQQQHEADQKRIAEERAIGDACRADASRNGERAETERVEAAIAAAQPAEQEKG